VVTGLGDLAGEIAEVGAGLVVPPGDADAPAEAVLRMSTDRAFLSGCAARALGLWEARFTGDVTTAPLRAWVVERPARWPASVLEAGGLERLAADRLRLQGEMDAIRGSVTFRALRLCDRLVGRARVPR
jgi:hypothetical protein